MAADNLFVPLSMNARPQNESVMFEKWLADVEEKHRMAEAASADEHKVMG